MINQQHWNDINKFIEKGYIIKHDADDIYQLEYKKEFKNEIDSNLGVHCSLPDKNWDVLINRDWTCDGDIFEAKTNRLVAKNLKRTRKYPSPAIDKLYPEIKTHPFSASLKIEGRHVMLYKHNNLTLTIADKFQSTEARQHIAMISSCLNPSHTWHFVSTDKGKFYYFVGITNIEAGMELSDNRFQFIADSILEQSSIDKSDDDDWTIVRKPETFSFRTFDQALDWVNENKKTLILKYDNGFKLELAPESEPENEWVGEINESCFFDKSDDHFATKHMDQASNETDSQFKKRIIEKISSNDDLPPEAA